jgi:SAM-dependent methyltransferase
MTAALDLYGLALERPDEPLLARASDGRPVRLALERWLGPVSEVDERVLDRAEGPVLDVGCGPGRHVGALARRGVLAVGVDVSPDAIRLARRRGALVLERSIFDRLPGAGDWGCALLLDGNVGIGGRPVPLLARLAALLRPGGQVLVELDPPGSGLRTTRVRLEHGGAVSGWFEWAHVAADAIERPAAEAGFTLVDRWREGRRWFGQLTAP